MTIESDADIVEIILKMAQEHGLDADAAHKIEQLVRAEHGGHRVRIPKKKKHLTPEQRQQVYQAGLSDAPTEEIVRSVGIHRSTLYRLMKRGGG